MFYNEEKNIVRYTLLRHLRHCCDIMPEFEPLYASLEITIPDIKSRLEGIQNTSAHYSRHDISHSYAIIAFIELFLGEHRIRLLSPTDTWMILTVAFRHDMGMVLLRDDIIDEWDKDDFKEYLINRINDEERRDLCQAASFFIHPNGKKKTHEEIIKNISINNKVNIKDFLKISWNINILITDYRRKSHAAKSKDISDNETTQNDSYMCIQRRLWLLCNECCASHGYDAEDILKKLPHKTNGFCYDYAHPRFVAMLLYCCDPLDLDNTRFNTNLVKVFGGYPDDSFPHVLKHMSITHMLVCYEKIEIWSNLSVIGKENNLFISLFMRVNEWFDIIEKNQKFFNTNWFEIVPLNYPGNAPSLKERKIIINDESIQKKDVYTEYTINYKRAFNIIATREFYESDTTFMRELVQNAHDAIKLQISRDMNELLDNVENENNTMHNRTTENYLAAMLTILNYKYENYAVRMSVITNEKQQKLRFIISDNGDGVYSKSIEKMQSVGATTDLERDKEIHNMPAWIRLTGAFGVGMHSVFSVSDEIYLRSLNSQYMERMELRLYSMNRGAKIVKLPIKMRNSKRASCGTDICFDVEYKKFTGNEKKCSNSAVIERLLNGVNINISDNIAPLIVKIYTEATEDSYYEVKINENSHEKRFIKSSIFTSLMNKINEKFDKEHKQNIFGGLTHYLTVAQQYLESIRIGDCYIWTDENNYYVLFLNGKDPIDVGNKNILLKVDFNENVPTVFSHKGSWINQTNRHNINLAYTRTEVYMLGYSAKTVTTTNRNTILPEANDFVQKDLNEAIRFLLLYIACNEFKDDKMTFRGETAYNLVLNMYALYWSDDANIFIHISKEQLHAIIQNLAKNTSTTIDFYIYDEFRFMRISDNSSQWLIDPLDYWYEATYRKISKGLTGLEILCDKCTLPNDAHILPDLLLPMKPNLKIKEIAAAKIGDSYKIYIKYTASNKIYIQAKEDSIILFLNSYFFSNSDNLNSQNYIPCFQQYKELAVTTCDLSTEELWKLQKTFIKLPYLDFGCNCYKDLYEILCKNPETYKSYMKRLFNDMKELCGNIMLHHESVISDKYIELIKILVKAEDESIG